MVLCGTVSATRHSRGSGNPESHSNNGLLAHGGTPLGPRLRGDDELSSKLFARHYTSARSLPVSAGSHYLTVEFRPACRGGNLAVGSTPPPDCFVVLPRKDSSQRQFVSVEGKGGFQTRPYEAVLECARVRGYQAIIVHAIKRWDKSTHNKVAVVVRRRICTDWMS